MLFKFLNEIKIEKDKYYINLGYGGFNLYFNIVRRGIVYER